LGKSMIWARVDDDIRALVKKLAACEGVSMSEYVRGLVIDDLDSRTIFTTKLKGSLAQSSRLDSATPSASERALP